MQTYAELMFRETISFQERYNFDEEEFLSWQCTVAEIQYGKAHVYKAGPRDAE